MSLVRALPRLRRASIILLALSLATVVAIIGGSSQAHARSYCPNGHVCMWEDANAQGDRYVDTAVGGVDWFYDIDGWNGDNEISSVENNSNRAIRVWTNDNQSGRSLCYPPHTSNMELGNLDNDFESFIVVRSC
jgi:hypothetical protein